MSVLKTADLHPQGEINQSSVFFDDFYNYVTTQGGWATAPAGSGSVALTTGNDSVTLTTAATLNDFEGIRTTGANWTFTSGQGMYAEAYITSASHATNGVQEAFGFASSSTLGLTVANSTPTVACGALIFKASGKTVWSVYTSCNSVATVKDSTATAVDANYLLRIDVFNFDGLNAGVSFSVNGAVLRDSTGLAIIQKVPYASVAAMYGVAQVGAVGSNAEALVVDYAMFGKNRLISVN